MSVTDGKSPLGLFVPLSGGGHEDAPQFSGITVKYATIGMGPRGLGSQSYSCEDWQILRISFQS